MRLETRVAGNNRQTDRQTAKRDGQNLTATVESEEEEEAMFGLRAMAWLTMCWYLEYFSMHRM